MADEPRKERPESPTAHPGAGGIHEPPRKPAPEPDGKTPAPDVTGDED
jgi:hypothetical protein